MLRKRRAMVVRTIGRVILAALVLVIGWDTTGVVAAAQPQFDRVPWTTSRIHGTPQPPPPYQSERIFPKLKFNQPVDIAFAPGSSRVFVVEQSGKVVSFANDPTVDKVDVMIDMKELSSWKDVPDCKGVNSTYGMTFHPQFDKNHYVYICYTLSHKTNGKHLVNGSRVSRFTVASMEPPRVDPTSELQLVDWLEGGHNGGCLKFGPDGCLYISTGDTADPTPPDPLDTGQDVSDLLSSILRIDVDHA